ncbi:MAG: PilT/PilU family type 4a pilus ATPase [Candidatus Omnitrophota bacterium]|jgi:twitching motility protein PilT|nr:MAG: PilT/PilU family type 4a pilus ATPase [Candidatus Omnitrophota bacterium]
MLIKDFIKEMVDKKASDLFFRAGGVPHLRIDGKVMPVGDKVLSLEQVLKAVDDITTPKQREAFRQKLDIDFALYSDEMSRRFRVSIFLQRNWPSIVIRNINNTVSNFEELFLPADILKKLCSESRGLVLLTGSAGSGKSTTIASMIEYINSNTNRHVLTVEEPIEYTFKDNQSIVNQRELGQDVSSYAVALRSFNLQSPDVIFIGNIMDVETMAAALRAAETGVLVLSTLHTVNAAQTVERIINFFPPHQHQQIRIQLSYLLKGVISLRLLPLNNQAGRIPAYEVMLLTPTISRLIREAKTWEIPQFIEEGNIFGMSSFNQNLVRLVREGKITEENAKRFSDNEEELVLSLRGIRKT